MAKLKSVTADEFKSAEDKAFETSQWVADLHRRASQGYADEVDNPLAFASAFACASRTLAEMSAYFIMKAALDEQRRLIEKRLESRSAQQG